MFKQQAMMKGIQLENKAILEVNKLEPVQLHLIKSSDKIYLIALVNMLRKR
jgi:ABC-type uncharacterized transport system substrate-binding protein